MASVQHLFDLGAIESFVIEQPAFGTVRAIVMGRDGVLDIREYPDNAPVSALTGVNDRARGPSVLCAWGYIAGRAQNVNSLVRKAIDAMPKPTSKEKE